MSSHPGTTRRATPRLLACITLTLGVLGGCTQAPPTSTASVWPAEAGSVESFDGYVCATAMPGDTSPVFAGGRLFSAGPERLEPVGEFAEDFEVGRVRPAVAGEPQIDGCVTLGSRVAFFLRGDYAADDTIAGTGDELVLIDPVATSDRESVCRVEGSLTSVQAYESGKASQAILFEWAPRDVSTRVVTLMIRTTDGTWEERWSTDLRPAEQPLLPLAWGFVSGAEGDDVRASVVGHAGNEVTGTIQPVAISVDLDGVESSAQIQGIEDAAVVQIEYLSRYATRDGSATAFRYSTLEGSSGLLLDEPAGKGLRALPCDEGEPLTILDGASQSARALIGPRGGAGPLQVMSLADGGTAVVEAESAVGWAARTYRDAHGEARVVLVGRSPRDDGSADWAVHQLAYDPSNADAIQVTPVVARWTVPDQSWYITSVSAIPDDPQNRLVAGFRSQDGGAVALVASGE